MFRNVFGNFHALIFLFFTSLLLMPGGARAMMSLPMDLSQMTAKANRIFVGRCLEVSSELSETGIPSTVARFHVLKGLKGVGSGQKIRIHQFGTQKEPTVVLEGEKAIVPMKTMTSSGGPYRKGEEYLLFLYPDSSLGLTSPVGGGQGKFEILTDDTGARLAVNPFDNRYLKGISTSPQGGPVSLDRMMEQIEELLR